MVNEITLTYRGNKQKQLECHKYESIGTSKFGSNYYESEPNFQQFRQ